MSALPNDLPRPPGELQALQAAWRAPSGWRVLSSVNNTHIGLFYIATALGFFVLAGVLALVMRAQLALPGQALVSVATYNQIFTMHGTVMMFLFAVPVVEAVAVYLLPQMLAARDLPFPRLSAYAFWAYAFGGIGFFLSLFFGVAPDGGWFLYPPLSSKAHSPGLGADFWLLGIGFIEISAIAGAVELIVGILMTRTPGMSLARMPVYAWAMLVVGAMIVFAFPAIIAGTALLELERAFDWPFFIAARGGDPLLWQHLFWFFGHPEVYIIFLPAAGLVSMLVPVLARTPLVGAQAVVAALIAVGAISFALWIHHMFTAGLGFWATALTSLASLAVALPTALQVFAWIATLRRGTLRWCTSTWFVLGFFAIFVLGGLTGVMAAVFSFNRQIHDTYFVVAHLHYVLIGGMVFPLFAALYHWLPLVGGHRLSERCGRWVVGLMFVGFNLAFLPMHASGLLGMARRVHTYPDEPALAGLNALSSVGAFVLAAGVALCLVDLWRVLRRPRVEVGDPWGGATLEWAPTALHGHRSLPQVASTEPLWQQPDLAAEIEAGAHWLPGTATGRRETLVTTPRDARPRYLMVLPGDGWLPLWAAAGTAGFFLLLTVGWVASAWACAIAAVVCVWAWLWGLDRPAPLERAPVGRDLVLPVGGDGRAGHALWGFVVVLVVDASVFLSLLYAHLHVAMAADVCPPPGAALPAGGAAVAALLLWCAAAVAVEAASRRHRREAPAQPSLALQAALLALGLLVAAAFGTEWFAQMQAGLAPRADAWSATVAALLANQGLHAVALLLLLLGFTLARAWTGALLPRHRIALDVLRLAVHASALQVLAATLVVRGLPAWL
jgi:cytochrome c oxidase subunit I+III